MTSIALAKPPTKRRPARTGPAVRRGAGADGLRAGKREPAPAVGQPRAPTAPASSASTSRTRWNSRDLSKK